MLPFKFQTKYQILNLGSNKDHLSLSLHTYIHAYIHICIYDFVRIPHLIDAGGSLSDNVKQLKRNAYMAPSG